VILVADTAEAQCGLREGRLVCPTCGGRFRKHGFSRLRSVRICGGGRRRLRPPRVPYRDRLCSRLRPAHCEQCRRARTNSAVRVGPAAFRNRGRRVPEP
jgi:hypothetical protein